MNATLAELGWLLAPATALLLGCLALVPLGCQVLARGVVFIDLAVAQVAACGALAGPLLRFSDPAAPHAGSVLFLKTNNKVTLLPIRSNRR